MNKVKEMNKAKEMNKKIEKQINDLEAKANKAMKLEKYANQIKKNAMKA